MSKHKAYIGWLVILMLAVTIIAPATSAYAYSLSDVLGQTATSPGGTSTVQSNSGHGIWDMLVGLLIGKLLGKVTSLTPDSPGQNGSLPTGSNNKSKEVVGFYAEWWGADTASFSSMEKNADTINTIAPFWATLHENGSVSDRGGNDHASVVKAARQKNISTLLLINNAKQEGNSDPIHTILHNDDLRSKSIDNIEGYIKKYGLEGVNIDFETVPAQDRDELTSFMKELYARLHPQGYVVSIDVFPKQDENNDVSIAYDYAQLAKYADKIMIMTYDQHGGWSDAGPIADIRWVENNLKYALKFIPANKIYLGIAAYGYDWSSKGVESLEYTPIMNLVDKFNVASKWDKDAKSPYFSYTGADGITHQVWYENSESLKYKLDLANRYNIAGIAIWKLGNEDPGYWKVLKENHYGK